MAIEKAEREGIKRLERIRKRKPYPKNAEEREAIRQTKRMLDEFRICEDLDRPEYYEALKNRRHWYDPLAENDDTFTKAEEGLHDCAGELLTNIKKIGLKRNEMNFGIIHCADRRCTMDPFFIEFTMNSLSFPRIHSEFIFSFANSQ